MYLASLSDFDSKPSGVRFDAEFECNTCGMIVVEAYGDPNTKTLVIVCDEGHKTVIKEWGLW